MFSDVGTGKAFPQTQGGNEGRGPVNGLAGAGSLSFILM